MLSTCMWVPRVRGPSFSPAFFRIFYCAPRAACKLRGYFIEIAPVRGFPWLFSTTSIVSPLTTPSRRGGCLPCPFRPAQTLKLFSRSLPCFFGFQKCRNSLLPLSILRPIPGVFLRQFFLRSFNAAFATDFVDCMLVISIGPNAGRHQGSCSDAAIPVARIPADFQLFHQLSPTMALQGYPALSSLPPS